jgi:hypothetical protein
MKDKNLDNITQKKCIVKNQTQIKNIMKEYYFNNTKMKKNNNIL